MQNNSIPYPNNLAEIILLGRSSFIPKENLTVSQYAAKYRFVSKDESVRSGIWDNDLVPFAVEPMDSFDDPEVNEVTFVGSAQVVKTEIIKNVIAKHIDLDPQKVLLLHPTQDTGRVFSKDKLDPMINNNPRLKAKIAKAKSRDSANTTLHKKYPFGSLSIVGSNSPNDLAQRSVKIVLSDDIDRIPQSAGEEGDPVTLAEERTESYTLFGYKHGRFSTPTIKDLSRIERLYKQSDQREYYIYCPYCNFEQTLQWENLTWEKQKDLFNEATTQHLPETAKYKCANPECEILIEEKFKPAMLLKGKWIPKHPERKGHRGYWINRLYSPFSTWESIVKKFLVAKNDPETLKTFWNTSLARTWEDQDTESLDDRDLLRRLENYCTRENPRMPDKVLLLTSFIDVQADRLELLVQGFGKEDEQYTVAHEVFYGEIEHNDLWAEAFDFVFNTVFEREDGIELKIRRLFIDSGAYAKRIYEILYTLRRDMINDRRAKLDPLEPRNFGVWATKGKGGYGRPLLPRNFTVVYKGRLRILVLGVDEGKTAIYKRLSIQKEGPKYMHFSKDICGIDFFEQLTAEKMVKKYTVRGPQIHWIKKTSHARNEVLDMMVGCLAAKEHINPNYDKLETNLLKKIEETPETKPEIIEETPPEEVIEAPRKKIKPNRRRPNSLNNVINF